MIIRDISRVLCGVLEKLAPFSESEGPPAMQPLTEEMGVDMGCVEVLSTTHVMLNYLESMVTAVEQEKRQKRDTVPCVAMDGSGSFMVCESSLDIREAPFPLRLSAIDAPMTEIRADEEIVDCVDDVSSVIDVTRDALEGMEQLAGPSIIPFAVRHYNRVVNLLGWLKHHAVLRPTPTIPQLQSLATKLNALSAPFSSMRVGWIHKDALNNPLQSLTDEKRAGIRKRFLAKFEDCASWEQEEWDFHDKHLSDSDAKLIGDALLINTTVTSIFMGDNNIHARGAKALARGLKHNETLTGYLFMFKNSIGDHGAMAFADALQTNGYLRELNLQSNGIGDQGAAALAQALKNNASLTHLYLNGNVIGDEGALALAGSLKLNECLESLDMRRNAMTEHGAQALWEVQRARTAPLTLSIK
eukprot:m.232884 g.232884  ORF g.232884 m.232884 type:complete len:415 (-) comp15239_c0_seq1:237-1481(-)